MFTTNDIVGKWRLLNLHNCLSFLPDHLELLQFFLFPMLPKKNLFTHSAFFCSYNTLFVGLRNLGHCATLNYTIWYYVYFNVMTILTFHISKSQLPRDFSFVSKNKAPVTSKYKEHRNLENEESKHVCIPQTIPTTSLGFCIPLCLMKAWPFIATLI